MTDAFVGATTGNIGLQALKEIIDRCIEGEAWAFLRSPHKVELLPFKDNIKLSDCAEGQLFTAACELRWKQQEGTYDVLLLSKAKRDDGFQPVGKKWETKDLKANFYPPTEARFPKGLAYENNEGVPKLDIGQRYFIDAQTACVQFIALRVAQHDSK